MIMTKQSILGLRTCNHYMTDHNDNIVDAAAQNNIPSLNDMLSLQVVKWLFLQRCPYSIAPLTETAFDRVELCKKVIVENNLDHENDNMMQWILDNMSIITNTRGK